MANELDETDSTYINETGRDVHVIDKKIPVPHSKTAVFLEVFLWILPIPLIIGFIFTFVLKPRARAYLQQLQQKIQHDASTIDNYQAQRVIILQNCAKLLDKAVDLDKSTFTEIARLRSGARPEADEARNELQGKLDVVEKNINVAFENYPDLRAHAEIADAMRQNSYLQQEITAAREVYNDAVNRWNSEIFSWPIKCNIAAKNGYTTRIPYIASSAIKAQSEGIFF